MVDWWQRIGGWGRSRRAGAGGGGGVDGEESGGRKDEVWRCALPTT